MRLDLENHFTLTRDVAPTETELNPKTLAETNLNPKTRA